MLEMSVVHFPSQTRWQGIPHLKKDLLMHCLSPSPLSSSPSPNPFSPSPNSSIQGCQ